MSQFVFNNGLKINLPFFGETQLDSPFCKLCGDDFEKELNKIKGAIDDLLERQKI